MPRRPAPGDRGETLIELLVTIVLMGLTVATILGAIANSIMLSGLHRKQAVAGAAVRTYAEAFAAAVDGSTSAYRSCGSLSYYRSLSLTGYTPPASFTPSVTAVRYWSGSAFGTTCGTDVGVQRLSLKVTSADGRVNETLDLVIRRPCRPTDTPCT